MRVAGTCVVRIELEVRDPEGEVVLSTDDEGPIEYLHGGDDFLLPGLERALEGAVVGTEIEVSLQPADAFGEYDYECLVSVPRSELPADAEIVPGDIIPIQLQDDDGEDMGEIETRVDSIAGDSVVLDANHPLAGQELTCRAKVLAVREATADELAGE
jgi:FKBP-type peptidyl-prolyl cis-trans isomerase SlyD